MKRVFTMVLLLVLLLAGSLIAIPFLFRETLLEMTRRTISRNLQVTVDFDDFSLSLVRNFPKATLRLGNMVVQGTGPFLQDTLLQVGSLSSTFGMLDLLSPGSLTLHELALDKARLNLLVNGDNQANWDIFPSQEEESRAGSQDTAHAFGMELSKIIISGADILYRDLTMPLDVRFLGVDLAMKGNLYGDDTHLQAEGKAARFSLEYDSASYIPGVSLGLSALVDINFEEWLFRFSEGKLLVNGLPLEAGGSFSMPGDSLLFDLHFASGISDLKGYLALVPPMYEEYIRNLDAKGKAELAGTFRGWYHQDSYPALSVLFTLAEGNLRYGGFPEEISRMYADMAVVKPQGSFNLTTVDISRAHAQVKNNPVDFTLKLDNLLEDLHFRGSLAGRLDFDQLKEVFPMDSLEMAGRLDVDLGVSGSYSAIEQRNYKAMETNGTIELSGFRFSDKKLAYPLEISSGKLNFNPASVHLRDMKMQVGQSDFLLSGSVADYYPYLFSDGTLSGSVRLESGFLNLNELMVLSNKESGDAAVSAIRKAGDGDTVKTAPGAFEVPGNLDLSFETAIRKALYDHLYITNISGRVTTASGVLNLSGLNMNLLDGEVKMAGRYENREMGKPSVDLGLELLQFDIPTAFQSLKLIRNYLPVAAHSKGRFSTTLNLKGRLEEDMALTPESLNGTGMLSTFSVRILNSPVFNKIKTVLREERLSDLRIDDFSASFTIENGNLLLKPFTTRIGGQQTTFSGKLNPSDLIDLHIAMVVEREALSENIEKTLGILPGQKNIREIPVALDITGPADNPEVRIDLSEAKALIKKEVRGATRDGFRNILERVGDSLKKIRQ